MSEVQDHYADLLARHYSWMVGTSLEIKTAEQKALLDRVLQMSPRRKGLAVDLGSGPGFQTFALYDMGFRPVLAVDTSAALLEELQAHQGSRLVQTLQSDLLNLGDFVQPESAQVIVCMGDTITHLPTQSAVEQLLALIFAALRPGGECVITYRDLSTELIGLDRFIPVQADDRKVMTCFLEFDRPDTVLVHDLVYTREDTAWLMEKSAYRKLRLPVAWLSGTMANAGLEVRQENDGRLICLVGQKPA